MKAVYPILDSTPIITWHSWDDLESLRSNWLREDSRKCTRECLIFRPENMEVYISRFDFELFKWIVTESYEALSPEKISHWAYFPEVPNEFLSEDQEEIMERLDKWSLEKESREKRRVELSREFQIYDPNYQI